jgi:TPR repeat protein
MYANGQGVPQDAAAAEKWYRLAAGQGYAKAQFNLDELRRQGRGVTPA